MTRSLEDKIVIKTTAQHMYSYHGSDSDMDYTFYSISTWQICDSGQMARLYMLE